MILLDMKDRRPIYEQLIEKLADLMLCGALREDEKLPSVRNLAADLSINPNTIQRAYVELERRGYIYSVQGKGSFVANIESVRTDRKEEIQNSLRTVVLQAKDVEMKKEEFVALSEKFFEEDMGDD